MTPDEIQNLLIGQLLDKDKRYPREAYEFILEAVNVLCGKRRDEGAKGKDAHLSGKQLSEGLRDLLIARFSCMAIDVLHNWGIYRTADFGNLVYNLIGVSLLSASSEDRQDDFDDIFDFQEAFVKPFILKKRVKPLPTLY